MRVLLVEDEPDLGTALKWALKQEKYIVDWVQDGNEAWAYLEHEWPRYTLAVIDWMLPGLSGLELCQQLRANHSSLPILMLTAKDRREDKVMGLDAGADDYLVKPFDMEELLARLRALQRRSPQLQSQQFPIANLIVDYTTRTVYAQTLAGDRQPIALTKKEFQLLEYFVSHPTHIVTGEHLVYQLWEDTAEPISNVVAVHMRLLRRKLAEYGCNDLIETLPSMGYRLNPRYAK
jgi:DNA-binding response OmpR family regulator